jgi:anti-anti-sigma factor
MTYSGAIGPDATSPCSVSERKFHLEMTVVKFGAEAVRLILVGELDVFGAETLDLPLATLAGIRRGLVVDMTRLDGIAAIGIRHLVSAARALERNGSRLVLLGPNPVVADMLMSARVDDLLLIVRTEAEACAVLHWHAVASRASRRRRAGFPAR